MKKICLSFLFVLAALESVVAQELTVKSFVLAPTDLTAQTEGRKDLNGDACALVKISFVGDVADVEGNVIKPLVRRNNETWAFMTQESRQMKVVTKDYLPLMVTFGDYGIEKLQGNRTYVLTLAKPSVASETQQMQTLTIKYSPMSAMVLVDNKLVKGSNGVAKTSLPIGQHSYIIACDGYESEEGMVKLKPTAPSNLQITLSKEMVSVSQSSQTTHPQQSQIQRPIEQSQPISSTASPSTSSASTNIVDSSESGRVITIPVKNGINIEMVKVEAGSFNMGALYDEDDIVQKYLDHSGDDEAHRVILTKNYFIGKYEVTQALWKVVMGGKTYGDNNEPKGFVSWKDCQKFISKLNILTGKQFRLPTEAEWEYAARGGKKSCGYKYSGGNSLYEVAWSKGNSGSYRVVGTRKPNELGIYDMSGNVSEWCYDWYGSYSSLPQANPTGADSGSYRVMRGGSFAYGEAQCKPSTRSYKDPNSRNYSFGFRLVLAE